MITLLTSPWWLLALFAQAAAWCARRAVHNPRLFTALDEIPWPRIGRKPGKATPCTTAAPTVSIPSTPSRTKARAQTAATTRPAKTPAPGMTLETSPASSPPRKHKGAAGETTGDWTRDNPRAAGAASPRGAQPSRRRTSILDTLTAPLRLRAATGQHAAGLTLDFGIDGRLHRPGTGPLPAAWDDATPFPRAGRPDGETLRAARGLVRGL